MALDVNSHHMVSIIICLKEFKYLPIECAWVCACMHACEYASVCVRARVRALDKQRGKKQWAILVLILYSAVELRTKNGVQFLVFISSVFCPWYWAYISLNQKNTMEVMLCWFGDQGLVSMTLALEQLRWYKRDVTSLLREAPV